MDYFGNYCILHVENRPPAPVFPVHTRLVIFNHTVNIHVGVLKASEDLFKEAEEWGYELYPSLSSFVGDAVRRRIEEIRTSYPGLKKRLNK